MAGEGSSADAALLNDKNMAAATQVRARMRINAGEATAVPEGLLDTRRGRSGRL
jgi:hypothetical protein